MQVPAYWPVVRGVQEAEKRGVWREVKKVVDMVMDMEVGGDEGAEEAEEVVVGGMAMSMLGGAFERCSFFASRAWWFVILR